MPQAEVDVRVSGLRKRYGDVTAVDGVDVEIGRGEFFTMLGPSGSGKTTTLRMIAGFELPDEGTVELRGRDVSRLPPYARDVNTVFQDYALFPHMTVQENVEYGLRVRRVPRVERRRRAEEALDLVRPGGLVCLITSAWFLDQRDASARAHSASQADLVSAIRLPQGTFSRLASTDVQADIVVLRRRLPGELRGETINADWIDLDYVPDELRHPRCHDKYMEVNAWYAANPRNVLGLFDRVTRGYTPVPTAVLEGNLEAAL